VTASVRPRRLVQEYGHFDTWPHGCLNLKKLAGGDGVIGMAFEKAPVPSSVPTLFVFQPTGNDRLVVTSQV
jgi:hypothetical protein